MTNLHMQLVRIFLNWKKYFKKTEKSNINKYIVSIWAY